MERNIAIQSDQSAESEQGSIAQFDSYLAQQPSSKQTFHRWMIRLQAASLGFVLAILVKALLVSVGWNEVNPVEIPFWWMIFAASIFPFAICLGLDTIILGALLPLPLPQRLGGGRGQKPGDQRLVTGLRAIVFGLFIIAFGLIWAGINLSFAYSVLTFDLDLLDIALRLLGIVIGVAVAVQVLSDLFGRFSRSR